MVVRATIDKPLQLLLRMRINQPKMRLVLLTKMISMTTRTITIMKTRR